MIRKEYVIAVCLTIAGLVGGYLIFPQQDEIARMEVQDFNYEDPEAAYEARYQAGDRSVDTVQQLVRIHTNTGNVNRAIEVLEVYVAEHPEDEKALSQLAKLYQFAQRYEDYVRTLEAMRAQNETPELLKELAQLYDFFQMPEKQKEALEALRQYEGEADKPDTLSLLANLRSTEKDYAGVVELLDRLLEKSPEDYTENDAIRHTDALLALDRDEDALRQVITWYQLPQGTPANTAGLVDMLHYQGNIPLAKQAMQSIGAEAVNKSPALLQSWVLILLDEGEKERAYKLLLAMEQQEALPRRLVPDLMYLSLAYDNDPLFEKLAEEHGLHGLEEAQLADIWLRSVLDKQGKLARLVEDHVEQGTPQSYPMVRALIAAKERTSDRHERIRGLLAADLSPRDRIRMAEAMAAFNERRYARDFLSGLPDIAGLDRGSLAALESIYLRLGDIESAERYIARLKEAERLEELAPIGLRTAAAIGNRSVLREWRAKQKLDQKEADTKLITDLFYQAANRGHLELALEVMQWQNDENEIYKARRGIADIYARTGRYDAALALLENDAPRNEKEIKDRIFLLSKLAPRSEKYRNKLVNLAKQYSGGKNSRSLKEAFVFALQDAGAETQSLPFMKQLADQYGGQWLLVYADTIERYGNIDVATYYRLKAAEDPNFSPETKLSLAYALADRGYRPQAEQMLTTLANRPETRIDATKQLAYLWGVRPTDEQRDWLRARWKAAEGEEKEIYGDLVTGSLPEDAVVAFVQEDRSVLEIDGLKKQYIELLARDRKLGPELAMTEEWAEANQDARPLIKLARLAHNYGDYDLAQQGYASALAIDPNATDALVGGTITAYTKADYETSKNYFQRYLAMAQEAEQVTSPNLHEAYYSYAEQMRRQEGIEVAAPYYRRVIELTRLGRFEDPRSLSLAGQSASWINEPEVSDTVFDYAFARHRDNEIVRADKAALLIDQKKYDEARAILNNIAPGGKAPEPLGMPVLTESEVYALSRPEVLQNGSQLVIRTAPESMVPRNWLSSIRNHPSVSYVTEGYDTVMIVTKMDYQFLMKDSDAGWVVELDKATEFNPNSESAQLELRRELLHARASLEEGDVNDASTRVAALEDRFQDDPQYLGFAANSQFYSGMWPQARGKIAKAKSLAPDNADIAQLDRQIQRSHADRVRADATWINRGDNTELRAELSAETQVSAHWRIGGVLRNHKLDVEGRLRRDGNIRGDQTDRQTAELYGIYADDPESFWKFIGYANNDTIGLGVDYSFVNALGTTTVMAHFQEPYFQFVESIVDDAVRDSIAVNHRIKPSTRMEISITPFIAEYDIDGEENIFESAGVEANVGYAVQEEGPYIGVGYGLIAEYELDSKIQQTTGGQNFREFPLRSREIHFGSVTVAGDLDERTDGSVLVGYGWDRLGGHGPAAEGQINHNIYGDWDIGARAFYGLDNTASGGDDLSLFNAYIQRRF